MGECKREAGVEETMATSRICVAALLFPAAVLASTAWSDFVNFQAPASSPEGHVAAMNMASTRRAGADLVFDPNEISGTAVVQNKATADYARTVTVNSFIANGASNTIADQEKIKKNIFKLCNDGAKGTSFASAVTATYNNGAGATSAMPP